MPLKSITKKTIIMYIIVSILIAITISILIFINLPKFGKSPSNARLERIKQSVNYHDGKFHNQQYTPQLTSDKGRIMLFVDFLFGKKEQTTPNHKIPTIKTNLNQLDKNKNYLIWFGHSSYLIQNEGKSILVDPVFDQASPISFFNKPFPGTDIYKAEDMTNIDYLIITHDHWDHLDHSTILKLKNKIKTIICPLGVGEHFQHWGFELTRIRELDWNENTTPDNGFTIHCLPSRHFSGRGLSPNKTLWASFLIETPSTKVYIGGDGGYGTHFAEIAQKFPNIDIAILENGQYSPNWKHIHQMPKELIKTIKELNPRRVFTFHNSKYALSTHAWNEPLNNIANVALQDSINLTMPIIGEVVYLTPTQTPINKWWIDNDF